MNTYDYFKVAEYPTGSSLWDSWFGRETTGNQTYYEAFTSAYYGTIYADTN